MLAADAVALFASSPDPVLASSYLRLIDFVYHSTVGLRIIKEKTHQPTGHLGRRHR